MIGIDLVEIPRMREALKNPRFRERVFSSEERHYCDSKVDPTPHYAARFAAKEAFIKATGGKMGLFAGMSSVTVFHNPQGQPRLKLPTKWKIRKPEISLTHTKEYAAAVCLIP